VDAENVGGLAGKVIGRATQLYVIFSEYLRRFQIMSKNIVDIGKHAVDRAFSFLDNILNPPLKEVGLLAQDQVRYWRYKNQIRILNRASDILQANEINPRKVPVRTLAPLLNNGSMEEDENMQNRWAALLAKAADPNYSLDFVTIFSEVLRQLSPVEVQILDLMYDAYLSTSPEKINDVIVNHGAIREIINTPPDEYVLLIQNLLRLNLARIHAQGVTFGLTAPKDDMKDLTRLSYYGVKFVEYCRTEGGIDSPAI